MQEARMLNEDLYLDLGGIIDDQSCGEQKMGFAWFYFYRSRDRLPEMIEV